MKVSYIEKLLLIYIIYCLLPVGDYILYDSSLQGWPGIIIYGVLTFFVLVYTGYRFFTHLSDARDRDPPVQTKVKGDAKAHDVAWFVPTDFEKEGK